MQPLALEPKLFPAEETLLYELKMIGAKGSVRLQAKSSQTLVELKCQILGSLLLPPKKIIDNEIYSRLEVTAEGGLRLTNYIDNDYKSEARRTLEIKKNLIESKYIKFEEERGYLDYPQNIAESELADPLSVLYVARRPEILKNGEKASVRILLRSGVVEIGLQMGSVKRQDVEALGANRELIRVSLQKISGEQVKGPYLSEDMQIWLDRETGIVAEISYPFLGAFGKATLLLTGRA